jgi:hypothetical protein
VLVSDAHEVAVFDVADGQASHKITRDNVTRLQTAQRQLLVTFTGSEACGTVVICSMDDLTPLRVVRAANLDHVVPTRASEMFVVRRDGTVVQGPPWLAELADIVTVAVDSHERHLLLITRKHGAYVLSMADGKSVLHEAYADGENRIRVEPLGTTVAIVACDYRVSWLRW